MRETYIFPAPHIGPLAEMLITAYGDGRATMAFRDHPSASWGVPVPSIVTLV